MPSQLASAACRMVTQSGKPCTQSAAQRFGGAPVCRQHADMLLTLALREVEHPGSALAAQARDVLLTAERDTRQREEVERARRRSACARVYIVEREQWVKIGWTVDVDQRMARLSRGDGTVMPDGMTPGPLRILALLRGGRPLESRLHARFAADRVAGEWFRPSPELLAYTAHRGRASAGPPSPRSTPPPLPPETELRARQLAALDAHIAATGSLYTVPVIRQLLGIDTRRAVRLLRDRYAAHTAAPEVTR